MPDPKPEPMPPATEDLGLPTPPSPGRIPPPKLPETDKARPAGSDRPEPPSPLEAEGTRPV